jgi:hypothetical protein
MRTNNRIPITVVALITALAFLATALDCEAGSLKKRRKAKTSSPPIVEVIAANYWLLDIATVWW